MSSPPFSRYKAAVQESLAPVQLTLLVQGTQKGEPEMLPHPLVLPLLEAAVASCGTAILPGEVSAPGAGAQDPQNAVDGAAVVSPRSAPQFGRGQ
jgi:hypothetical protein